MKNILIINTVGLQFDGITNVIYTYLSNMDLSDLKIFVASAEDINPEIRLRFEKLGITVVHFISRKKHTIRYFLSLVKFIIKNRISVIHAHGNSATLAIEMFAALLCGVKKRITHSHSSKCESKKAHHLLLPFFKRLYTDAIACGEKSGDFLFKNNYLILPNGRKISNFLYDENVRKELRNKYNISNQCVFGHVGGFYDVKNHEFLLKVYSQIARLVPDAVFFMVGDGELRESITSEAKRLNLNVIFTGNVTNVNDFLQMMDAMIFPSKYEGVPLVVLEWQLNGLPILMTDTISKECIFMDNVKSLSLDDDASLWAKEIISVLKNNNRLLNSQIAKGKILNTPYNIENSVAMLRELYLN